MGAELGIKEGELQWLVSSYSLAAVRLSNGLTSKSLVPIPRAPGMPAASLRQTCRCIRKEEDVGGWSSLACRVCYRLRVRQRSVDVFVFFLSLTNRHITDDVTLNVLRALQGIGGAAIVPAAVRLFQFSEREEIKLLTDFFSGNTKMGILAAAFPPSQARSAAFATFGAGAPIGEGVYGSGPKRAFDSYLVGNQVPYLERQ